MSTLDLFATLQHSALSQFIGKQNHLLGAFAELLHVAGLILVLSSILLLSLRLLGLGLRQLTPAQLLAATSRYIWIGLLLLLVSGLVLFLPAANLYYPNPIFWFKFKLLAFALLLHFVVLRAVVKHSAKPIFTHLTAFASLGLWFGVAFSGRFIGFF